MRAVAPGALFLESLVAAWSRRERLGRHRWVVERTFAWLHRFRRLLVRYGRRSDIHLAFLTLAAILVVGRFLGIGVMF